jgi:hypothetical protein
VLQLVLVLRCLDPKMKYEGPPVDRSPGVKKPSPGLTPRGPEKDGERYQHFDWIVGALRVGPKQCRSFSRDVGGFSYREARDRDVGEGPGGEG